MLKASTKRCFFSISTGGNLVLTAPARYERVISQHVCHSTIPVGKMRRFSLRVAFPSPPLGLVKNRGGDWFEKKKIGAGIVKNLGGGDHVSRKFLLCVSWRVSGKQPWPPRCCACCAHQQKVLQTDRKTDHLSIVLKIADHPHFCVVVA